MAQAHFTVDLIAAGTVIGSVQVPMKLTAGDPVDGHVAINPDAVDLTSRIKRGVEAFKAAVE